MTVTFRPQYSSLLRASVDSFQFGHGLSQKRQPLTDHRLHDREIRVVIVMDEDIAHARDLLPLDLGSLVEQSGIDVLDRFAYLHQAGTTRVVNNTLV